MLDIDVNAMISGIFMSATMRAAVPLGQDYRENSRSPRDTDFVEVKTLCKISQKFIFGSQV